MSCCCVLWQQQQQREREKKTAIYKQNRGKKLKEVKRTFCVILLFSFFTGFYIVFNVGGYFSFNDLDVRK
jgi:hypothetical protein